MAHKAESLMERYHSLFVWYISARYLIIGIEYLLLIPATRKYWVFSDLAPQLVGGWMFLVGALGVASRVACLNCWTLRARKLTALFILGVMLHSIFRLTSLIQNHALGDPLAVLFVCDLAWVTWLQFQLKKWVYCR